jgi:hypothetical protein
VRELLGKMILQTSRSNRFSLSYSRYSRCCAQKAGPRAPGASGGGLGAHGRGRPRDKRGRAPRGRSRRRGPPPPRLPAPPGLWRRRRVRGKREGGSEQEAQQKRERGEWNRRGALFASRSPWRRRKYTGAGRRAHDRAAALWRSRGNGAGHTPRSAPPQTAGQAWYTPLVQIKMYTLAPRAPCSRCAPRAAGANTSPQCAAGGVPAA